MGELIEEIAVCVKCGGLLRVHTSDRSGLSVNISIKSNLIGLSVVFTFLGKTVKELPDNKIK